MKCNLKCKYLATVHKQRIRCFEDSTVIVYAYCRKYGCDLACFGGMVHKNFKCKGEKNERI